MWRNTHVLAPIDSYKKRSWKRIASISDLALEPGKKRKLESSPGTEMNKMRILFWHSRKNPLQYLMEEIFDRYRLPVYCLEDLFQQAKAPTFHSE